MNFPDGRLIVGTWVTIALYIAGSMAYFYWGTSSANVKRRAFLWHAVVCGVLINVWFGLIGGRPFLLLGIPLAVVCGLIAVKTTRFCDACGWPIMNQFIRKRFCSRCGADLDAQDAQRKSNERI